MTNTPERDNMKTLIETVIKNGGLVRRKSDFSFSQISFDDEAQLLATIHAYNAQMGEPVADGYFYTSLSGEKCHFFGSLNESTKNMFDAGYITELKPFYFHSKKIPLFDKEDDDYKITLCNTPLYKQAYDLIQAIEGLGASFELTLVVTQAGKLADEIVRRELNFHRVCKAFNELNAPTKFGEPIDPQLPPAYVEKDK